MSGGQGEQKTVYQALQATGKVAYVEYLRTCADYLQKEDPNAFSTPGSPAENRLREIKTNLQTMMSLGPPYDTLVQAWATIAYLVDHLNLMSNVPKPVDFFAKIYESSRLIRAAAQLIDNSPG